MFFIQADITIETSLKLHEIARAVSQALNVPPMELDQTGRYEVSVYTSTCFGLELGITQTDIDPPGTYHLFLSSLTDAFDFDGSEKEVDATHYVLLMLNTAGITASPRDPNLLY